MKPIVFSFALALGAATSVLPATQGAPELIIRDSPTGTIDCSYCTGMLDFCFQVSSGALATA